MRLPAIRSLGLICIASCSPFGSPTTGGRPVREVYGDGGSRDEIVIRSEGDPGGGPRMRPVIYPPKVFAVYVQEHLDLKRDIKIGAHWVHFKLRDSSWVAEEIDRELFAEAVAGEADLLALKTVLDRSSFPQIIIPYRASSTKPEETHEFKND